MCEHGGDTVGRFPEPVQARAVLVSCHGADAGAEALFRAFLCERDCNPAGARFWINVYGLITAARCPT